MESDASTSPRRRSTSCYSDSGDSSCSGPFSECGSDDLSFTPTAAAGIHRILLSCTAEASEDAIASLVASLESPSLDSLRRTAMELRLLAKHNPENRVRIAAAGAVRPLVALLSHPDPLLQEHGVTALLNLSLCDENKAVIVEAGAVRPLVHALKSAASPAARENAACALLRLAQLDGSAAAAIGRAGAIPLLVSLLETGTARGKKDAATALYALCSDARENRLRAVEAGALRPLLDLMAGPCSSPSSRPHVDKAVAPSPSPRRLRRRPGRAERSVQESSQPPAMSGRVAPANLTSSASSSRRSSAWRASRRCRSTAWSCPQVSSRLRCSGEQDEQKGGGDGACGRFRFHLQIRFQSWWGTLARLDRETPYYRKCASFCFSFFYLHGNSL